MANATTHRTGIVLASPVLWSGVHSPQSAADIRLPLGYTERPDLSTLPWRVTGQLTCAALVQARRRTCMEASQKRGPRPHRPRVGGASPVGAAGGANSLFRSTCAPPREWSTTTWPRSPPKLRRGPETVRQPVGVRRLDAAFAHESQGSRKLRSDPHPSRTARKMEYYDLTPEECRPASGAGPGGQEGGLARHSPTVRKASALRLPQHTRPARKMEYYDLTPKLQAATHIRTPLGYTEMADMSTLLGQSGCVPPRGWP